MNDIFSKKLILGQQKQSTNQGNGLKKSFTVNLTLQVFDNEQILVTSPKLT